MRTVLRSKIYAPAVHIGRPLWGVETEDTTDGFGSILLKNLFPGPAQEIPGQ